MNLDGGVIERQPLDLRVVVPHGVERLGPGGPDEARRGVRDRGAGGHPRQAQERAAIDACVHGTSLPLADTAYRVTTAKLAPTVPVTKRTGRGMW